MKKTVITITVIISVLLLSVQCFAEDVDVYYSGPLTYDYDDEAESDTTSSNLVEVTDKISYNKSTSMYHFYASGIAQPFTSNVCDGMVTQGVVSITVPKGIFATLYYDNNVYEGELTAVSGAGKYNLQAKNSRGEDENILRFTIIGEATGIINSFSAPDGFRITSALMDDENIFDGTDVSLEEEGEYSISYVCEATRVSYDLDFIIDKTPPTLALAEVTDGKAHGPVSVADLEPGGTITVVRDGEVEGYTDNQLAKSGKYTLYVYDAAMNMTEYNFTIMIYFNMGSIVLFIAVVALVAGLLVYIWFSKKRLKVR